MDLGLTDRVYVVTDAGTGLGRACAEQLAAEGARLVLAGPDDEALTGRACPDSSRHIRPLHEKTIGRACRDLRRPRRVTEWTGLPLATGCPAPSSRSPAGWRRPRPSRF